MPNCNIGALRALKLAAKEEKRAEKHEQGCNLNISRWQSSPLDLSESDANTDFLDIPCTPVAPTTPAAAEAVETAAATLNETAAVEIPPNSDDEAEHGQDRPKRARKSSVIMNVGEFPTNFKRKKEEEVPVSLESLGNAIYDEQLLVEGFQQVSEGCRACGGHYPIDFEESVTRGLGGHLKFKCSNKKCGHETNINKSKMIPTRNAAGKPGAPKAENTMRGVAGAKTSGIGHTQFNQCLLAMNMQPLNTLVWSAHGATYSAATKENLDRVILENIEKEKMATLSFEGDACNTSDGKIKIKVMTDGSWQKRYGRNSLYGIGAMYGFYTGSVLFTGTKCARCAVCISAASRGVEVAAEHKVHCTNTWGEGEAASLMEREIALEGVKFLYQNDCVVSILIVDGDTKTVQYIRTRGPRAVAEIIEVWLDLNHVEKNVGKKLRELQGVTEAEAAALQKAYCRAVKVSREKNPAKGVQPGSEEETRCAEYMQEEIRAAPGHLFNKDGHGRCKESCPNKAANAAIYNPHHVPHSLGKWIHPGPEDVKYKTVVRVFEDYSSLAMCTQLIFDCSTNPCEGVNSLGLTTD